jgi:hypothetical protein
LARDSERPIQTDSLQYHLDFDGRGLHARIPYVFTNRTGGTVSITNCRGLFALHLEREANGSWHPAWSPVLLGCLSAAIVIENNAEYRDTVDVWGAPPGGNSYPQFDKQDPTGTYRIVWDDDHSRVSNRFVLTK